MRVLEIKHNPDMKVREATIVLRVDEIRDMNNLLYQNNSNTELHRDMFLLLELVKNGCIDRFTVQQLETIQSSIISKESEEET